jgi:hypothetical protein
MKGEEETSFMVRGWLNGHGKLLCLAIVTFFFIIPAQARIRETS